MLVNKMDEIIRKHAEDNPDKIAIEYGDKKISYFELEKKSNIIANFLIDSYETTKNVFVVMEKTPDLIEAIVGIIKSGGVFVPIDYNSPENRIISMLSELEAEWLVTTSTLLLKVCSIIEAIGKEIKILVVDEKELENCYKPRDIKLFTLKAWEEITKKREDYCNNKHCYIYFTSGSTGKPKGVLGRHRSLMHFIAWEIKELGVTEKFKISLLTPQTFDPFLRDVFVPLCAGATLCIPESSDLILSSNKLIDWISEKQITLMHTVPSVFKMFSNELKSLDKIGSLKFVLLAGEVLRGNDIKKFLESFGSKVQLINLYGPTETTLAKFFYRINEDDGERAIIPVGKPIDMTSVFILDEDDKKCPSGVIGEIYIRTPFITSGYCNDRELTKKLFIRNPFNDNPQDIIYKTGDQGRILADGNLEVIGRIDNQVKIRGMRIELGEIESKLMKHPHIEDGVIIAVGEGEDKNLYAYFKASSTLDIKELRQYLIMQLPEYMVPAYFIQVAEMPLSPNGKIDRKKLQQLKPINLEVEVIPARNEVDRKLIEICLKLLKVDRLGINNDFFEAGGHSLKAAQLISEIYKELDIELSFTELFKLRTLKNISDYISKSEKKSYERIEQIKEQEYYLASAAQKRMYMLQQFDTNSIGYNMPAIMEVCGRLDRNRVEKTVNMLIERHETLRTSFEMVNGEIIQRVNKLCEFEIGFIKAAEEEIEGIVKGFIKAFELNRAPLLRVGLIEIHSDRYILMFDMHHIIADGISRGILIKEFAKLYEEGKLEELKIQYKDYSEWQNKLLQAEEMKKQEEYWLEFLSCEIPVLNLPTDYPRPLVQSFEGESINFKLDKELTKGLREISRETSSTMFMVLLSGINILLSKYSNQEDIIIGSPIAGRHHPDLEGIIGIFVNTLALRNEPRGEKTYEEFLEEVRAGALKAFENQDYQFEELVDKLNLRRDMGRNPLFDVMFVLQNMDRGNIVLKDASFKPYINKSQTSKFDILISAAEDEEEGEIFLSLEYSTRLFKKATMDALIGHFKTLLKTVVKNRKIKLSDIEIISGDEKLKLMYEFNDTNAQYQEEKTIHELFEAQVERTPEKVAVTFEDKKLTYLELNLRANKLARTLREKGVVENSLVGIMAERSIEMVVGLIAIMKAGGAFLPIDPEYPFDRIEYMLEDSGSKLLLTQESAVKRVKFEGEVLKLEDEKVYSENGNNLEKVNKASDLIYVIYTSGSTGKPKGAMLEHRNLSNLINFQFNKTNINFNTKVLQFTTISFDVAYQEIFSTLLGGGQLCIINNDVRKSIPLLLNYIEANNIKTIFLPTAYFILIENEDKYIDKLTSTAKHIITAGEQLIVTESLRKIINKKNVYLHNHYGPSETHVVTTYRIDKNVEIKELPPIGKPIDNTKVYILNEDRLVPIGVTGELCLAGASLGRGYLNNQELTSEKFVENPFAKGERMYRTGDLARWLPDGNLEFLGRLDQQVKIRGFRIELGEVESKILACQGVSEAVVIDRQDAGGNKYLCAYIIAEREITLGEFRSQLVLSLPEYMIPSYFIFLDKLPHTPSGKLDRRALPEPGDRINTDTIYEAPRNKVEEKLCSLWEEILGVKGIGINDNFFELGGHSLKATILAGGIHKGFDIEISLKEIFRAPTIRGISEYIRSSEKHLYSSIKKVEEKDYYEASSAQKRMYMLQKFDLNSTGYNISSAMEVRGHLDKDRFERAIKQLIERHETLRTSFEMVEEEIIQRVNKNPEFEIEYMKILEVEAEALIIEKVEGTIEKFVRPFPLDNAPLIRVGLIEIHPERHVLMFDMHHIISDGMSHGILIKEFTKLYEGEELAELNLQYRDYSQWQNELLSSEGIKKQEEYWIKKFDGELPILNLPTDHPRPTIQSFEGDRLNFKINGEQVKGLREICRENGTTMYMVLLSGMNILLSKYCKQEDIIIGSPIAGRFHADLEEIIGMFVNTLVMRNEPSEEKTYIEFLREVKENALRAYENQDYQFEELVDKLNIRRDISRNPLFDVMFTMQNMDMKDLELSGVSFKQWNQESKISKFDLSLTAIEEAEELLMSFEYSTSLFNSDTIERMVGHFENIIKAIVTNRNIKLKEIDILGEAEKHRLIYEFNDTYTEYSRDKTMQELFEEQVERTPENIALVFEEGQLTYRELNEKSNRLARILREKGVRADSIVGIMVERSLRMVVGIMGIMKAGGAYLPIDPEYPESRIQYMLEDSGTRLLLTEEQLSSRVKFKGEILDLGNESSYSENSKGLEKINTSNSLVYIIYTSGTTGNPKGVMIEHRNLIAYVTAFKKEFKVNEADVILQQATYCFDGFVEEIYGVLLAGAKSVIAKKYDLLDPNKLKTIINKNKITLITCSPLFLSELNKCKDIESIRAFISGGDILKHEHIDRVIKQGVVYNAYGPTEATVCALYYKCKNKEELNIPVGKPISNYSVYLLDKNKQLVPMGVPGEICISGAGVARGYLNGSELTAERFVENPFAKGERMYLTGDLGRWRQDGNIEFLGRKDNQVKIRSFRIELGELENIISTYDKVKEVVVIDREDEAGNKYLSAYFTSEEEISGGVLREYLSDKLPYYMLPAYFMQIDKLPVTSNGKLDKKALPKPEGRVNTGVEYEAPRNEIEEKLCRIWVEVLGVNGIGIMDNFFELGGHSLKATMLSSRIHKSLNIEVPLKELFRTPTIKGIGEYINSNHGSLYSSIEKVEEREYYEASSAQKRIYLLQQFDINSTGYNMPMVMEVEGKLDKEKLENAVRNLIERHKTLRTSFEMVDGRIMQKISKAIEYEIKYVKLSVLEAAAITDEKIDDMVKGFVKVFDLSKAPLLRVVLVQIYPERYILMFDVHHIIFDGVSMGLLIKEFIALYEGKELKELSIQYSDYSEWQNKLLRSIEIKQQEEYWLRRLFGELPVLNLPTDYPRPLIQSFEGDRLNFKIGEELTRGLREISRETGTTMYMVLLCGVNILLSKYSGAEDIIIGSPIAGRAHTEFEGIIGMFVNTLTMRNAPSGEKTYEELLREVKENALRAYENQDYQFEELVEKLDLRRDISRNPLFDVMFTMQNMDMEDIELNNINFKEIKGKNKTSKFDLTITAVEAAENILLSIEYSTKLFKQDTIARMTEHLENIFKAAVENIKIKQKEIMLLGEAEKHKLIYELNDTYANYPREKTLHGLFEAQAARTPENVALVYKDQKLTYRELNERGNRLARTLREKGVKSDSIVGIMIERSLEMIVGIMGILKAGGAYLPIDPEYPEDRIAYTLEDSKTCILLTQRHIAKKMNFSGEVLCIEDEEIYSDNGENLNRIDTPSNLAYIIYTSGTTGNPKGVMIEHRNVVRLLFNEGFQFGFDERDIWTMFHSFCFDFSVWEMYGALLYGGKLIIIPKYAALEAEEYLRILRREKVTVLNQIPTPFYNLMEAELSSNSKELCLRYVIFGGEALNPGRLGSWKEKYPDTELINMYGITETTVHVTFKKIGYEEIAEKISNIGKPIPTLTVYIMDSNLQLQPIGVPGEICVGGEGVGRGYLNKPELTREKFIQNPYRIEERLYRSGDLARLLPSGEIEYLGRIDHQVKLRGFRIELGEIESCILDHKKVREAVVVDGEDDAGDKYLCAYLVTDEEITVGEFREYLAKKLPDYMIPAYFVRMEKMPLTNTGKLDKKALPKPEGRINTGVEYEAPRNEVEKRLCEIWREVLGVEKVGIKDNFFELGGHSLKATILSNKVHMEFDVEIPLKEIFQGATVQNMAEYLHNAVKHQYISIEPAEHMEYYPVSSAQKRLFVMNQLGTVNTNYNMPFGMTIEGKLDIKLLEKAFSDLIMRHESLRTSFELKAGEVKQQVHERVEFELGYEELVEYQREVEDLIQGFVRPFDLSMAPLLRVKVIKLGNDKHLLMLDMHHIISDGVSMSLLIQEFMRLYEGKELESLKLQYKDYAVWQNRSLGLESIKNQGAYWLKQLSGELVPLIMPLDHERPELLSFEGRTISFEISSEIVNGLKKIIKAKNVTMNMLLISIYNVLLNKYSGQEDIIVGSLVAGRRHQALQNIVGMFGNFLPIRSKVEASSKFSEYIEKMKQVLSDAYDNQDYPFDQMVEELGIRRDPSRNPIFDTMLVYHNEIDSKEIWKLEGLNFERCNLANDTTTLDFKMDIFLGEKEELRGSLQYNKKLFEEASIKELIKNFCTLADLIGRDSEQNIKDIEIFDADKKQAMAKKREFNLSSRKKIKLVVTASFTSEPIKDYAEWWCGQFGEALEVEFAAYNQVFQELLKDESLISTNTGANLILVRFEDWIRDSKLGSDKERCIQLEKNFKGLVKVLQEKQKVIPYFVGVFPISTHLGYSEGVCNYMELLNMRWEEELKKLENIHLIDFREIANFYSITEIFDALKDKAGHIPFSDEYYVAMGTMIARKLCTWRKQPFKVLAVDCDNTLWRGICGEEGPLGVTVEEPFKKLQSLLLQKYKEGMLLVICSKNNEEDVWRVFDNNPGMLLKKEHFVDWRINWKPKSQNLKEMASALNLGVNSFIFIDDSPTECFEVMTNCPEVLALQLPSDPKQIPKYLYHVWAFDKFKVTEEDRNRSRMYAQERKRQALSEKEPGLKQFLESLKLKVSMNLLEKSQLSRAAQLTQRTNQFNLSTLRRTEEEIEGIMLQEQAKCWVIEVCDRFGDYGLVGVVIGKEEKHKLFIDTLLLSCRVLGRGVEFAILSCLKKYCMELGLDFLEAKYYPTEKNKPIKEFLVSANWSISEENDEYISYKLPIEFIADSVEYIECYFNSSYKKVELAEDGEAEAEEKEFEMADISAYAYVAATAEGGIDEYEFEGNIEVTNEEKLLYKEQLLPLRNCTGRALMKLPVHETQQYQLQRSVYKAPRNLCEEKLEKIWNGILGASNIGIEDNFFKIGGDSLKAITMASQIHKEFNVELSLKELFEHPRIVDIARCISRMKSSGDYRNDGFEQAIILLNSQKGKNIYLFPPVIGYAISYKYISNFIENASVYALDFLQEKNRLKHYVDLITKTQKEGPYVLLGYSAGGNLAYEVAKELESQNYEVSDLIFFDSYKNENKEKLSKEDIQRSVDNMIIGFKANKDFNESLDNEVLINSLMDKFEGYETYTNEVEITGQIKANIRIIRAGDNYKIPNAIDTRDNWRINTSGDFISYEGFGNHFEMINQGYAEKNAEILNSIIKDLK